MIQVFFEVPESYGNSLGEVVGLNGPYGKGEKGLKGWSRAPSPHGLVRIGLGGGGASLLPSPLFLLPFLLLVGTGKGARILLGPGVQVGLPPLARPLFLPPLYTWAGGTPKALQDLS